jgi:large subunit ribosomal protein L9
MKLILTQEVDGLGSPGDVVEVKAGYGRNYLVPRGLATAWTRGGQKTIDSIKAARATRAVRGLDHAEEIKGKLEGGPISVKVRAGAAGRLFGAVTVTEIADALTVATGEAVDKRTIAVTNPIKTLGAHQVSVKLHEDLSARVSLNVIPA